MDRIKVVIFEPGKPGRVDYIPNKLRAMQQVVKGERSERRRGRSKRGEPVAVVEKTEPGTENVFSGTATGQTSEITAGFRTESGTTKVKKVRLCTELVVVCNEEGRLLGLPENRLGICGTFFVAGDDGGEDFVSLTRTQVDFLQRYMNAPK